MTLRKTARRRLKRLVADWEEFHSRLNRPEDAPAPTAEDEKSFMRLKGHMASTLAWLATLEPEGTVDGFPATLTAMTEMLGRYHSLAPVEGQPAGTDSDFNDRWHEYYIFLSKLLGVKMRVAAPKKKKEEGSLRASLPRLEHLERPQRPAKTRHLVIVRTLPVFTLVLVAGLFYMAGSALGLRWENGTFTVDKPGGLADALNNILSGLLGAWESALRFADPIIASYGLAWTLVMMGLLLMASLYLVFSRQH